MAGVFLVVLESSDCVSDLRDRLTFVPELGDLTVRKPPSLGATRCALFGFPGVRPRLLGFPNQARNWLDVNVRRNRFTGTGNRVSALSGFAIIGASARTQLKPRYWYGEIRVMLCNSCKCRQDRCRYWAVVSRSPCPSRTWMVRKSVPASNKWVAQLWRRVCGVTRLLMPARRAASLHAIQTV